MYSADDVHASSSKLAIDQTEVSSGNKIIIIAKVTNTGGAGGSYIAELMTGDTPEQAVKVTVASWDYPALDLPSLYPKIHQELIHSPRVSLPGDLL